MQIMDAEYDDWHALQPIKRSVEFGGAGKRASAPEKHMGHSSLLQRPSQDTGIFPLYLFDLNFMLNHSPKSNFYFLIRRNKIEIFNT